jgi:TolB protein
MKWLLAGGSTLLTGAMLLYAAVADPVFQARLVAVDPAGGGDATISPDGRRIITSSARAGNWDVWMYDLAARRWTRLTDDPADDFEGRLSPDGRTLAFTSTRSGQKDVWTLDLSTRALTRLTHARGENEYPVWSPDGRSIVYTGGEWGARDVFMVPSAGGAPRRVTHSAGRAGACGFDPDGASLVCHRYDGGSGDLERVWIEDGEVAPLTGGDAWDYKPMPSPDGRWVAFSRAIEGPSQIWMMPSAGGRPRPLIASAADDRWPTWTGDGTRMLFHRLVDEGVSLEMLDRQTGRVRVIAGAIAPLQASLNRTGTRVAYCARTPQGRAVHVIDLRTNRVKPVDTLGMEACFPRWSPIDDRLALAVRGAQRWEIALAHDDGARLEVLTEGMRGLRGMDGVVDWSPDAARVVFHSDTEPFDARLFSLDVKTRELRPITGAGWYDESPSWTRDGRGVVFTSTRGGNWSWGFFRASLDDGAIVPLLTPDNVEKNYLRTSGDGAQVWSQLDDHQVEHLMERRGAGEVRLLREAGDGARWPSYSADERWVLYTRVRHRVEYWIVDHPAGKGSPFWMPSTAAASGGAAQRRSGELPDKGESPHALHRR